MIALALFALALALDVARHAQAQDAKNPYPTGMAPLDQYLMGRDAEIALAPSAAPSSVAKDATVMVLQPSSVLFHPQSGSISVNKVKNCQYTVMILLTLLRQAMLSARKVSVGGRKPVSGRAGPFI